MIGFFGVFNSVFTDGRLFERLVIIGVILMIYLGLGMIWGFLLPDLAWKWGMWLSLPGAMFLLLYTFTEQNLYYIIYLVLLMVITCLGAYLGSRFKRRRQGGAAQ